MLFYIHTISSLLKANAHFFLILFAIISQSSWAQEWLARLGSTLSSSQLAHSNLPGTAMLTRAILNKKQINLAFYLWLVSMIFEYNYLVHQGPAITVWPFDLKIPWFSLPQLVMVVSMTLMVTNNSLEPSNRRVPVPDAEWEEREIRPIYIVSSPAVGPAWLSVNLNALWVRTQFIFSRVLKWLLRIKSPHITDDQVRSLLTHSHKLVIPSMLLCSQALYVFDFFTGLVGTRRCTLISLINLLMSGLVYLGADTSRLWPLQELLFHHAIEVDGFYYELQRTGWLTNSIDLSIKAVPKEVDEKKKERVRQKLSRHKAGDTFFTKEEIKATGMCVEFQPRGPPPLVADTGTFSQGKLTSSTQPRNSFSRHLAMSLPHTTARR